jgi:hypothetical protein
MAEAWREISEGEAPEEIREIYRDVQFALRVSFVPLIFRVLAAHAAFFRHMWGELKPTITDQWEETADGLRGLAVAQALERLPGRDHREQLRKLGYSEGRIEEIQDQLHVYHYVDPKLTLLTMALHEALEGRRVGVRSEVVWPSGRGVPAFMPRVGRVELTEVDGEIAQLFEETKQALGLPMVSDEVRTLAQWPEYFQLAWKDVAEISQQEAYSEIVEAVREEAERAMGELRRRLELRPEDLRRMGIDEAEQAEIRGVIAALHHAMPILSVHVAYWTLALAGPEEAKLPGEALLRRWSVPRVV